MPHKCPFCEQYSMVKIEHGKGKHYFLCEVDTNVSPANIDITTGIPVDAFGCTKCGTIILNNPDIKQ